MSLGLSSRSRKTKIGSDPRNTHWANDTGRFGHQHMLQMGWKPGKGLGHSVSGRISHISVKHRVDNKGLGHKSKAEELPHGLDVFQRILGKLNGDEEAVERQLADKKKREGLYLDFVPGGVLEGTVEKLLHSENGQSISKESEKEQKKLDKKAKKAAKAAKDTKQAKEPKESKELKEAKEIKKPKKESKSEHSKKSKNKKDKKKQKAQEQLASQVVKEDKVARRGIRATRSRFIEMKRKATTDPESLREILMR